MSSRSRTPRRVTQGVTSILSRDGTSVHPSIIAPEIQVDATWRREGWAKREVITAPLLGKNEISVEPSFCAPPRNGYVIYRVVVDTPVQKLFSRTENDEYHTVYSQSVARETDIATSRRC